MSDCRNSISDVQRILVIKLRNIGDVLLTSPVFANLRIQFPAARLCALVNSGSEEMITGNPCIDQVYVYDRRTKNLPWWKKIEVESRLVWELRKEKFDLVINLTEGDRGALVSLLSGARFRVGMDAGGKGLFLKNHFFTHLVKSMPDGLHSVQQNLYVLERIGVQASDLRVSLPFSSADREFVATCLSESNLQPGKFFHAHMTSRWLFKALPPKIAARIVDELADRTGCTAVFTAAPVEKELAYLREVVKYSRSTFLDLGGKLTLKQLGALSSMAKFFVGVDSAPMHMAAAVDTPVLALFGPSSARKWGPWDNSLRENPYKVRNGVQVSLLHMVLQSNATCVPCYRDGCNGSKVSDCLFFPDETLTAACADFLARLNTPREMEKTK